MKLRFPRRSARGESGFTLPELILTIAIEVIIFGALASAFVVVLKGGDSINKNLAKSNDARFAANYMISDARNSSGAEMSLTDTTSCPDPSPPVAGPQTAVARFNWTATTAGGATVANISNYVLVSSSLLRRHCENGVLSASVIATDVAGVTVTCAPVADCSGTPTSITVVVTETPDMPGGTAYSYSLTAAFRKLVGGGGSLPATPQALVVFGSGGCAIDVSGGSTIGLKVYGDASINAVDSGSCKAINLSGSGKFSADSTAILQGGSCVASGGSTCPPWTNYQDPVGDPFAGTPIPPTQPNRTNACGGTFGSATALAGNYTAPFVVQGSVNCTLSSGIYVFQAGFSVTAGATLTTAPGGVLLYLKGGAFNIDGAGNVTLAAQTSGPYSGLVVWQDASDATTFNLAAGGVVAFSGAIYAPNATLLISGNAQGTKASSIVTKNIVMNGSAGMIVGAPPLTITAPATLPAWTVGRLYPSTTLTGTGGNTAYTWSQTGLPTGMALSATTGVISGTPTVAGPASVTITLNDAAGDTPDTQVYALAINALPVITTVSPLAPGEKSAPYLAGIATTGGTAPFVWTESPLPAGVTFSTSTGALSGTPTTAGTTVIAVGITDAAGATVTKSLTLVIAVQATITSVTLTNGGSIAGRVEKGDTISIVFSKAMSVSSFCSTWTNDAANQSLTADADVGVTLTNATRDTISVTSGTCVFNFGLLDLGVGTYVSSANAVFGGSGTNKSTIAYNVTTRTLLITLGTKGAAGTVATVTTSTPIYTAGAIQSSSGGSLGNSPFTLPAGKKF